MTDGKAIKDWIEAGKIAEEFGREPFFGIAVQALIDDGGAFCVVFDKNSQAPIKGGLKASKKELAKLKEMDLQEE